MKNTLGYLDIGEFVTKIRIARHIGVRPVFAVRALPKDWAWALIRAGGYAMIMRYQFYPWTHKELADEIRTVLGLPVDTPKRIEQGTMERFEEWLASPRKSAEQDSRRVQELLERIEREGGGRAVMEPEKNEVEGPDL